MKHIQITEHTWVCTSQSESRDKELAELGTLDNSLDKTFIEMQIRHRWQCCDKGHSMRHIVFYLNNDFYLVSYQKCLEFGDHLNFKEDLIKKIIQKYFVKKRHEVYRGYFDFKELKKEIMRGELFKIESYEVHYLYSNDNRAIQSRCAFTDRLLSRDEYDANYLSMKAKLNELFDDSYLQDELDLLYRYNNPRVYLTEIEEVKTVELLIKQIQNEIKH